MTTTFFLRPSDFQATTVTDEEIDRALLLARQGCNPLTGFEIHFVRCVQGDSRPACPKERALLRAVRVELDLDVDIESLRGAGDDSGDDVDFWSVDTAIARAKELPDLGASQAFGSPGRDPVEALLDRRVYEDWKADQIR